MKDQMQQLLEKAKESHATLKELKMFAVKCKEFELADGLRDIERELYPETEEQKNAKELSEKLNLVFRMVNLNIDKETCWLINATLKKYWKRRGNFDLKDSSELIDKKDKIFNS